MVVCGIHTSSIGLFVLVCGIQTNAGLSEVVFLPGLVHGIHDIGIGLFEVICGIHTNAGLSGK